MAVSSQNNKDLYTGTGSQVAFSYTFRILDDDDILVDIKDTDGVITTQIKTTNYTVTGVGQQAGGTITFVVAPLSTDTIILTRSVALTQEVDYKEQDTFPAETHEEALDKLTMINQQQQEELARVPKFDSSLDSSFDTTFPTPISNGFLKVNGAVTGMEFDTLTTGGLLAIVQDLTPQLGGDLDTNANNVQFDSGTGIYDDDGNAQITFTKTTNAVNSLIIQNAAAGGSPKFAVSGSDTNIDITFQAKGTGQFVIRGSSTSAAGIELREDTSNGSNFMGIKAPASVTANVTLTLPDGDGTEGQVQTTDGSGTLSWTSSLVKISETTASSAASVVFTGLSTSFRAYKILISELTPATDSTSLLLTVSNNGGSSYASSGYYYGKGETIASIGFVDASANNDSSVNIVGGMSNASSEFGCAEVLLYNPSTRGHLVWESGALDAGTRGRTSQGGGITLTSGIDAIKFAASSGNISGKFTLYGIPA